MKVYIITDMEGVSGIQRGNQGFVQPGTDNYPAGQDLMVGDINAAVAGAFDGGAKQVVVCDGHGLGGPHIPAERLDPRAVIEAPAGATKGKYMPSLDSSFSAFMIVGAHAMAGTAKAFLDHTQSSRDWYNFYLNGRKFGEIGQWAVYAGHFGVPVVMISGDAAAVSEARALLGKDLKGVAVKQGITRYVAKSIHPEKARKMIREAAKSSLNNAKSLKPLKLRLPIKVRVVFQRTECADAYDGRPGIRRIDGRTITCTVPSQLDILNF